MIRIGGLRPRVVRARTQRDQNTVPESELAEQTTIIDFVPVVEADLLPEQAQLVEVLLQLEHVLHVLLAQTEVLRSFLILCLGDVARHQGHEESHSGDK